MGEKRMRGWDGREEDEGVGEEDEGMGEKRMRGWERRG